MTSAILSLFTRGNMATAPAFPRRLGGRAFHFWPACPSNAESEIFGGFRGDQGIPADVMPKIVMAETILQGKEDPWISQQVPLLVIHPWHCFVNLPLADMTIQ